MANAETSTAPLKKEGAKEIRVEIDTFFPAEKVIENSKEHLALTQVFDTGRKYMYQLANENEQRQNPVIMIQNGVSHVVSHKKYITQRNIIFSSQIVWEGQRRNIRYYDGCTTLFVDKQPQDKDAIAQAISNTKKHNFIEGKAGFYGEERMLLLYLNICSWNVDSPFRTQRADGIFRSLDQNKAAEETSLRVDQMERALSMAKDASQEKMLIHAEFLEIPTMDWDSDNAYTPKEIRAKYREYAINNPSHFIETYGNKNIEVEYRIKKALEKGTITNKNNPNKATWGSKGTVICDISGLKSQEAIAKKIFEYSQTDEGSEFLMQLKALPL
jgi:hypothetical protein